MDSDLDLSSSSRMHSSIADVDFNATAGHEGGGQGVGSAAPEAQRRWVRFAVDIPVQVRLTTQGPTRVVACEGQGTDISFGGLAVRAGIDLPIGTQVGVEFTPPYSDQPMLFRCFVRNRDGDCYGVEFIMENDDDYRKAAELQAGLATRDASDPLR